ncbi:MAG: SCP2 sterol-binding domain-containing protein [Actinobacteria bacterium]|nr:SCP2 sterol-binding domain-containing protein [Actinomycetota bacterium]MBU4301446.1 SCP2 sterol-binding domain-containing protein [Actinomycetota bacterium]
MSCDIETWQQIMDGNTQAAMTFMGGNLKFTGEMTLAMQLNALL